MDKISLIIPTLNERGALPQLFDEIKPLYNQLKTKGYDFEVIIIDDNSKDGTPEYIKTCLTKNTFPIKLIERQERGLATAVIRGINESDGNIIGVMDADLSHPPALLTKLIAEIPENDLVIASRNILDGGAEEWPIHRKLTSAFATALVGLLGIKVRDPMSGFFLFKRTAVANVPLSPIGYKILLEILTKGKIKKTTEVAYIFRNRTTGNSKMNTKIILQYLKHLWLLKKWQKTNKSNL